MKPYHRNPRRITKKRYDRLTDTLSRLGDLGGIVHNMETDEIIGGNQRMAVFKNGEPVVVEAYDQPDEQGTVAHGFVIWQGKKYAYRQVRWDEQTAAEANIAANVGAGDWDWDALSGWDAGDLQAWGFDQDLLSEWRNGMAALIEMTQVDVIGEDVDDDSTRDTNNMSLIGKGENVGFHFGDIMVTLPREVYDRMWLIVDDPALPDRRAGVMRVLEAGLADIGID